MLNFADISAGTFGPDSLGTYANSQSVTVNICRYSKITVLLCCQRFLVYTKHCPALYSTAFLRMQVAPDTGRF